MTLQNFLNILFANWQNVLNFVQNFILSAISLISNFWNIIQQKKDEAVSTATVTAVNLITNGINLVTVAYRGADNFIHGRIDSAIVDFLIGIQFAKETLGSLIELARQESKDLIATSLNVVYSLVTDAVSKLQGIIDELGLNISKRIDQIYIEFNKIVDMSGLTLAEKRALLKMFLDDPLGFIASVFFEIAIPILLYELAKGMSELDADIGEPPVITSISPDTFRRRDAP